MLLTLHRIHKPIAVKRRPGLILSPATATFKDGNPIMMNATTKPKKSKKPVKKTPAK